MMDKFFEQLDECLVEDKLVDLQIGGIMYKKQSVKHKKITVEPDGVKTEYLLTNICIKVETFQNGF